MKIGDKIRCSNGHIYTLGKGDGFYSFSIVDEYGEEVNMVHDYYIHDCIISDEDDYKALCVGADYKGIPKYTDVLELIESK